MLDQFSRTQLLIGPEAMARLAASRVAVFGIGGVGGFAVEALARSGVGALELVDDDLVGITNINRQIIADTTVIGQHKVDVMARRIAAINPDCRVTTRKCFFLPANAGDFDFAEYDYVVDAVDTVTAKLRIVQAAHEAQTPVISCMGAANKLDPTAFRVADIDDTRICPLARIMRKECRKRGIGGFKAVYSEEPALKPLEDEKLAAKESAAEPQPDRPGASSRHGIPASIAFVPSVAGLICAGEVIKDLIGMA